MVVIKIIKFTILFGLIIVNFVIAQTLENCRNDKRSPRFDVATSLVAAVSYTGYSIITTVEITSNSHTFYVGPKLSLSDTYLPGKGPFGIDLGWQYIFKNRKNSRFNFLINFDYQLLAYQYKSRTKKTKKHNYIHELNMSYGIQLKITEQIYLSNSIGIGGYWELYHNDYRNSRTIFAGYNNLIKLFITYKFKGWD